MVHQENAEIRKLRLYQQLKIPEARDHPVELCIMHALCPDTQLALWSSLLLKYRLHT